jgi:exopolyphosphatase/pppGpp-phosphohydrolase
MWALISIALIGIVGGLVISIAICMAIKKAWVQSAYGLREGYIQQILASELQYRVQWFQEHVH